MRVQAKMPKMPVTKRVETKMMRQIRKPESIGALAGRGGRFMTSASVGSKARAIARPTELTILTQRICRGVIGRV